MSKRCEPKRACPSMKRLAGLGEPHRVADTGAVTRQKGLRVGRRHPTRWHRTENGRRCIERKAWCPPAPHPG